MNVYERDAVREVIEQLIAEIGPDNVPSEIDVEGALKLLDQDNEDTNAPQEESSDAQVEAPEEPTATA